jgi:hypothetical protein
LSIGPNKPIVVVKEQPLFDHFSAGQFPGAHRSLDHSICVALLEIFRKLLSDLSDRTLIRGVYICDFIQQRCTS